MVLDQEKVNLLFLDLNVFYIATADCENIQIQILSKFVALYNFGA